ncbi:MAG: TonB-dependent receptor [Acidobacteria bacterium]|nr:TonB-dependent receptor [Acidobacteriota bacterium]
MKKVLVSLVVCLVLSIPAFSQTSNATLGGTVSDASGALIPGVTVTAANTQTGIVTSLITNEAGAYQFASLQTGTYTVSAELSGFQTQARTGVSLGVSQQVRLNFTLQVGTVAQSVEVSVAADTLIATTSSSVGAVLPEYKVRDLPLSTRYVLELVQTTAGTNGGRNFAGGRGSSINVTRDGVPTNDGRYAAEMGVSAAVYVSPDLVEEVRVIVAPADAETGRGSGQVQMATRSGTNEFHGSLFWTNRNSVLEANSWLNNFNGVGKNYRNGNQFGGRLGGPIIRNKTFFFFLFEGQRYVTKKQFTGTVLTEEARKGNFRFFPGVQNGNILSNNPVVDVFGNPVTPRNAQGGLQTISVFGRDPLRPGFDTSGWVQRLTSRMPLPNDFTVGDGLNTAGHRWLRRVVGEDSTNGDGQDTNRNQYNVRIDHNFNARHKASFTGTKERNWAMSEQAGISNWPGGYDATLLRKPEFYSASLVSTLSSAVVNEFRFGYRRTWQYNYGSAFRTDEVGEETRKQLPTVNGQRFFPSHSLFPNNIIANLDGAGTRGAASPIFSYNDTLSWTQGKHAFKTGFEVRFSASDGFNGTGDPALILPSITIGAGSTPVRGISTIPGLAGTNITAAQNLLLDLSGSVGNVSQEFHIRRPTDSFIPVSRRRDFHQNEWGAFFKDDWKIRPDLTLNVGVRYDYYGVPWEKFGTMTNTVGGEAGLFGLSGTSFADMWQPGRLNGSLTMVEFVGKNSPNPDKKLYKDDWNNFAPAVGFSWSAPWWGQDKTVLRAGYGINYSGAARFNSGLSLYIGSVPGASAPQNLSTLGLGANYFNLSNLPLPVAAPTVKPLFVWELTRRNGSIVGFTDTRVVPYIQNWNLEIQRELASNLTLEARYIGSKGTKLWGRINLNTVNIFENGILEAFKITREGGNAPLFDQMLRGLNLGSGVINGRTVTGSASLRANTLTRGFLANGNVGQFADFLNSSPTVTNRNGGLLLNSGLFPENFIKVNPQFGTSTLDGNPGNSTYHSMQLQVTKRLSHGFTNSTSYTWSRTISNDSNDGGFASFTISNHYFDPRNRALNKALVAFHRTHDIRSNGTLELPFGPTRRFLNGGSGVLSRLVEQWQLGAIFSWTSGAPLSLNAPISTITQANINMPLILGDFPKSTGKVTPDAAGATYFPGFQQVADPARSGVTTLQGLQNQFSNRAIADARGNIILANPGPGQLGTLGQRWIEGPGHVKLDMNLVKRIRIDESKQFEVRVDARNILNTPWWADPQTSINALNFGRMTASGTTGANSADINNGARSFTLTARLNF